MWFRLFGDRRLLILLTSFVLLIIIMGVSGGPRSELTWPEKAYKSVAAGIQGVFYKPAGVVASFIDHLSSIRILQEENTVLRNKLENYVRLENEVKQLQEKQNELEKLVSYAEKWKEN